MTDWLPTIVAAAGGDTSINQPLDGHDIWQSLATGGPSPRTEMLYNVNPLTEAGQAGHPHAGLRVEDYKILCCKKQRFLPVREIMWAVLSVAATSASLWLSQLIEIRLMRESAVGATGTYRVKGISSSTLGEPSVATGPVAMAANDTRGDPGFAKNNGVMMFNRERPRPHTQLLHTEI